MFTLIESVRSAVAAIVANTLRSILTTLGIVIGVAAIIAVISLIEGVRAAITEQFAGMGTTSIRVRSHTSFDDWLQGRRARLTPEDVERIASRVDGIESITPVLRGDFNRIRYGSLTSATGIFGTTRSWADVSSLYPQSGRFITDSDHQQRRRVCVIGEEIIENLELPDDPVGDYISINDEWFKVVGVMEKRGEIMGDSQDNFVIVPYGTMVSMRGNQRRVDVQVMLSVASVEDLDRVSQQIRVVLRDAHQLGTRPDDFRIERSDQMMQTLDTVITTVTLAFGGIVGISLLVGGIGIMNIMLVSVTERTREIGICKALGARRRDILLQFLVESATLSVFGGLIGLVVGYGLGAAIGSIIPDFPGVVIPLWAIFLAIGFSGLVGILFGILPAMKAARLDPIDALRYE